MKLGKSESQIIIKGLGLESIEENGDNFNFRCPVCGDSQKDQSKKRGYFFWDVKNNTGYRFKCFNCSATYSLTYYLKLYEPNLYKQHMFDKLKNKNHNFNNNKPLIVDFVEKVSDLEVKLFLTDKINKNIIKPYSKLKPGYVVDYINNRMVPKNKHKRLFFVDNFYRDLYEPMKILIKELDQDDVKGYVFDRDPRLFWFIKNRNNEIIGIQGRSLLSNSKMRYLTIKITTDSMIGNLENVRLSDTVLVTEGYIDSLFLDNAVSLNGSSFNQTLNTFKSIGGKDIVFIYDNEPYNKEILKKVNSAIDVSINERTINVGICLLPKNIRSKGKDINDYIKSGISKKELSSIVKKNTFYGKIAKIKLKRWK